MTPGSILSGIFHIALALLVVFGLPSFLEPPPEPELPATVDVVIMAPKATAPELTKPPVPKRPDPPRPEVKQEPTPPTPPPPKAAPEPEPKPPTPQPKVEEPKPEPLPVKKVEEKKPEKREEPKPVVEKKKPEPKKTEVKKPEKDFDSVLESVLKNKAPVRPAPPDPQAKPVQQQAAVPQRVQSAPTLSEYLARSELDAVRDKIRPCWNFPVGAPNPEQLVVEIQVLMNPDGTVREALIVDRARMIDPFFRSAAEAALRAALNPTCQPLPLPPHKYNLWRNFIFSFDPRYL